MKVIRLQRGYVIRLSDSEMDALDGMVGEAEAGEIELALIQYFSPAAKAAYRRRTGSTAKNPVAGGSFLRTDEDRRK